MRETGRFRVVSSTRHRAAYAFDRVAVSRDSVWLEIPCLRQDSLTQQVSHEYARFRRPDGLGWAATGVGSVAALVAGLAAGRDQVPLRYSAFAVAGLVPLVAGLGSAVPVARSWTLRDTVVRLPFLPSAGDTFLLKETSTGATVGPYSTDDSGTTSIHIGSLLTLARSGTRIEAVLFPRGAQNVGRPVSIPASMVDQYTDTLKRRPPTIELRAPAGDTFRASSTAVEVAGRAWGKLGIARIVFAIDDTVVKGLTFDTVSVSESVQVCETIPVPRGASELKVLAQDVESLSAVRTVQVFCPPPIPRTWVLAVGVSGTTPESRARFAADDARACGRLLAERLGVDSSRVKVLVDSQATLSAVAQALEALSETAADSEQVIVFLAGCGAAAVEPSASDPDRLAKHFLLWDSKLSDLYTSALPIDDVGAILGRCRAKAKLVFLDAGFAGGRSSGDSLLFTVSDSFLVRLASTDGCAVVTAARTDEVVDEDASRGHGFLSLGLLEAACGLGDQNGDRAVTADEFWFYLSRCVPERTGGRQHPTLFGTMPPGTVLGTSGP